MSDADISNMQYNQYNKLQDIDQGGKIIAEYVWIDGSGILLRSKCRTLNGPVKSIEDIPEWNYDGSSCYQATTENSEVIMKPVAYFRDPFRRGDNIMVLTETYKWTDSTCQKLEPCNTNFRYFANKVWNHPKVAGEETWYGIEQEYTLLTHFTKFTAQPLGWPSNGYPGPQGPYYCSVGATACYGRVIADVHYKACLFAGVTISGTNAEVMPGQWEYQVGPAQGVDIGDHMWISRYLLSRVAEDFNIVVSFAPKLFPDWNGSGCHTNYSTRTMRDGKEGMAYIEAMMGRFAAKHSEHCAVYGDDNDKRLTGIHETSSMDKFTYGVANRAASFRIPTSVAHANGKGYIEDRRPASNIDPYIVGAMIADTSLLEGESEAAGLLAHYQAWKKWRAETDDIPRDTA
jgi:glutamine synthetase